jgi:hypothetical protein
LEEFVFIFELNSFFFDNKDDEPSPGGCFFISSKSFNCLEKSGFVGFVDF